MMGKWMTLQEVMDEFGVAERTFHRWRKRHPIRAGHITRRHPTTRKTSPGTRKRPKWQKAHAMLAHSATNDTDGIHP
jgi:transposase-like protein